MKTRSNFIGLSSFSFGSEQKVGCFCDSSKLSKFALGCSIGVILYVASTIQQKQFLVRRERVVVLSNYET